MLCHPAEEAIELGARAERFYWIVMEQALLVLSVGLVKVSPAEGCTEAPNKMTVRAVAQLKGSVLYAGNGDSVDHVGPYPSEKDQGLCSGAAGRPVIPGEEDLRLLH
jgi:hypothetical protein